MLTGMFLQNEWRRSRRGWQEDHAPKDCGKRKARATEQHPQGGDPVSLQREGGVSSEAARIQVGNMESFSLHYLHNRRYFLYSICSQVGIIIRPHPAFALMCWFVLRRSRKHSIISDLFEGIERSQVTCRQCGRESFKYDPFMSVLIEIGRCAPDVPKSMWSFIGSLLLE